MGFFTSIQKHMSGASIAVMISQAKEGKLTVMIYPTNQKDDETFIPINIADTPEMLDDNIEDFLDIYLKTAVERFSSSEVVDTTKPSKTEKKKETSKDSKKETKTPADTEKPAEKKPEEKKPDPKPAEPDLFNTVHDPEDYVEGPEEPVESNEIDEF